MEFLLITASRDDGKMIEYVKKLKNYKIRTQEMTCEWDNEIKMLTYIEIPNIEDLLKINKILCLELIIQDCYYILGLELKTPTLKIYDWWME